MVGERESRVFYRVESFIIVLGVGMKHYTAKLCMV